LLHVGLIGSSSVGVPELSLGPKSNTKFSLGLHDTSDLEVNIWCQFFEKIHINFLRACYV
jgi:hypothetical protein